MRTPIRASMIAAFSILLGSLALGCGDPGSATTTGAGGSTGGTGGVGGQGGEGGQGGGMTCSEGATQDCYSGAPGTQGTGICKGGKQTCSGGKWGACDGEVLPAKEECNKIDDDCNGQADDGFAPVTCGQGACSMMVDGCVDGMAPACTPGDAMPETCDGTDEDCDGQIDNGIDCPCTTEGETRSCYSGGNGTVGVGECKTGTQTCTNMAWGPCEGEVLPIAEVCDAKDNDCDGMSDENIPKKTCGAGACLATVEACINGQEQPCTPGQPKTETCNNIDDDCNLFIDDGLGMLTCGMGGCMVTVSACVGGVPQTCMPGMPQTEVCDGIDNNCNSIVDEGNPGGGVTCNTGLPGACAMGTLNCTAGALKCEPNMMAGNEICDGKDNDCDGMVDDGNPGGGMACMTGVPGACAFGTSTCSNGSIICTQTVMPKPETCNGVDDNCNGAIDEGTSGGACTVPNKLGPCAAGTANCMNGSLLCTQTYMPTTEVCNGIDDNCSGQTDEGNPGGGGNCTVQGQAGPCAAGALNCNGGALQCTQTTFAVNEVCGDNVDNDCNGTVDNGCCSHSPCQTGGPMAAGTCGCAANVCSFNNGGWSYCCNNTWDPGCTVVTDFACGGGTCCAHTVCATGGPLATNCSSCVAAVCAAKPACCTTGWTEACVDRVPTYCGGAAGLYCGSCPHSVCVTGVALVTGCNSCVTSICNAMPSCCGANGGTWTQACANLVATQCTSAFSCN